MAEIDSLASLDLLRTLNLQHNPVCELPDYRLAVIHSIQQLTQLDGNLVDVEDKVNSWIIFIVSFNTQSQFYGRFP
jgi:hypothetical protein